MADCFISYGRTDMGFATRLQQILRASGLDAFLAQTSIRPGEDWSDEVREALRSSPLVVFVASKTSCQSPFVQQELGGALFSGKQVLPILLDVRPETLPGWARDRQALAVGDLSIEVILEHITALLTAIRSPAVNASILAAGAAVLCDLVMARSERPPVLNSQSATSPPCPNCSTSARPFLMSPIPVQFRAIEGVTHACSKCGYKTNQDIT